MANPVSCTKNRSLVCNHFFPIVSLGFISFVSCIIAEFKKTKFEQVKFNGHNCYVPRSQAFICGMIGLISLSMIQIIASISLCRYIFFTGRDDRSTHRKQMPTWVLFAPMATSWISFAIAVLLLGAASSMNRSQPNGEGWVNGACYVVKDGIFVGSAMLVLVTTACILITSGMLMKEEVIVTPSSTRKSHNTVQQA